MRFSFSSQYPPVYIRRKKSKNPVDVFKQIDSSIHNHPFAELFEPKTVFDDKTRTEQPYEMVVPTQFDIPREMWRDYKTAFQAHFPGGTEGLKRRLYERDVPRRSRILRMLSG